MKNISQKYQYDEIYFEGKIPEEARYLPDPSHELPLYIEEGFFSPAVCDQMVSEFREAGSRAASPVSMDIGIRKTEHYDLDNKVMAAYQKAFERTKPKLEQFFRAQLIESAGAHALGYYPGGLYGAHCDNCNPLLDENGKLLKFQYTDPARQISIVLFLTDSVTEITGSNQAIGGNLSFPFLQDENNEMLLIEPRKGLFVSFTSNPVFGHEVHVVYEGYRMTIVDWHTAVFS